MNHRDWVCPWICILTDWMVYSLESHRTNKNNNKRMLKDQLWARSIKGITRLVSIHTRMYQSVYTGTGPSSHRWYQAGFLDAWQCCARVQQAAAAATAVKRPPVIITDRLKQKQNKTRRRCSVEHGSRRSMSCEWKNCYVLKFEKFQGLSKKEVIYMGGAYLFNVTSRGIGDTTCLPFIYYSSVKYIYTTYEVYVWWTGEYDMNWVTQTHEGVSLYRKNGTVPF